MYKKLFFVGLFLILSQSAFNANALPSQQTVSKENEQLLCNTKGCFVDGLIKGLSDPKTVKAYHELLKALNNVIKIAIEQSKQNISQDQKVVIMNMLDQLKEITQELEIILKAPVQKRKEMMGGVFLKYMKIYSTAMELTPTINAHNEKVIGSLQGDKESLPLDQKNLALIDVARSIVETALQALK